ncbi:SDR family oxidoreductase [Nocardioides sp. MAH-18]|uniref:SDR family oxidoreductase n=1 Tax=Nocardioides agri TaxID=2682843 RepID=A0A6L6XLM8_9ACTN|nr:MULTISPECIES: SDR family NAD(P)-dependent oxidoreductase [unclassified Nocardioides]MBA2953215.1 SDR family oxidoreductase [Nocardioides sp. CGMCC 1.13656]MVQ48084.1 SDR family oxidoreductase [Nocardioides sp. MAH-18]
MGQLEGRVAVVTGAGTGLGREHALLFAAEGAAVVVNDLVGADEVAEEIRAAGGRAVGVAASIAEMATGELLVATALEHFGDLHAIVNNAGVVRDAMVWNMTEDEFDLVLDVHLKGTFSLTRAAARHWRDRAKAGERLDRSIVNTTSAAGLHGNVGQWNYAAAKAGLAVQATVAAQELGRYGVRANAISPAARTAMVTSAPALAAAVAAPEDEEAFDRFHPRNVSPLVAYLASADCPFTGQVFSVTGGHVGLYAGHSVGHVAETDQGWTVAELADVMGSGDFPRSIEVRTPQLLRRTS